MTNIRQQKRSVTWLMSCIADLPSSTMTKFQSWENLLRTLRVTFLCAIVAVATASTSRAVTITGLTETATSLQFDFSGTGFTDFIRGAPALQTLTSWAAFSEQHRQLGVPGTYGFEMIWRHLSASPIVVVDAFSIPFGTAITNSVTVPHGDGFDILSIDITVQDAGNGQWATFAGSFSGVHIASVPEEGSAFSYTVFSLVTLIGFGRFLLRS